MNRFSLDSRLSSLPTSTADQQTVTLALWSPSLTLQNYQKDKEGHSAFIEHVYIDLCRIACTGPDQLSHYTHRHLSQAFQLLQTPRITLNSALNLLGNHDAEHERLVRVAAALLTSLNIAGVGGVRPGRCWDWPPNQPLEDLVSATTTVAATPTIGVQNNCPTCSQPIHLSSSFNAYNFEFLAGFEVKWTSILSDHLRVVEIDEKIQVYIFHHAAFLQRHKASSSSVIPEALAIETLETLALILPRRNTNLQSWYTKLCQKHQLDSGASNCPQLPLENRCLSHFKYWQPRLADLKDFYDSRELHVRRPIHFWRDRTKPLQWWTFWIAVFVLLLTIVFGLIQSITGILQVTFQRSSST